MMRKLILLALALMTVLVSCGPVTAVPSVTPIPSVTPTRGPVTASAFRLREMSESEFISLINTYDVEEELRSALFKEALLKFPESEYQFKLLGNILAYAPETRHVPGVNAQEDVVSWMIARMLESGVPLEDLEIEIEKSELYVYESLSMKNLMGIGEDDLVLRIAACKIDCRIGIWAVFFDGQKYHVEKMRDWYYVTWSNVENEMIDAGDTNGNGLSELLVHRNEFFSGSPAYGNSTLTHIEWSHQDARFQVQAFSMFDQSCFSPPEYDRQRFGDGSCNADWEFVREGLQSQLITNNYWLTHESCPFLAVQRVSI